MIVAEHKPIKELLEMIEGYNNILLVGCKGCVTVCNAGGSKEVAILAAALRIARRKQGKPVTIDELTLDRQCEPEFISWLDEPVRKNNYDAIVSLACSIGPQYIAEEFDTVVVLPGLNTGFMGGTVEHGIWEEYCAACGDCVIQSFGGLCPITRCAKGLLNGPCGGSVDGKCEVNEDMDCIWELIFERMKSLGQVDRLRQIVGAKDWSTSLSGGPRKIVREDLTV
ncbi:MAG: methylenetetrahydrofolate reductase C-terminal domain-containing protein [Thermodesulfobacteriota bacterium]|nr:methylenetetrahydrofolate reductase C-terminal domain-containing protein [Thermodesulfobacteriota bacterium]